MSSHPTRYNLAGRFSQCIEAAPDAPALWHDGRTWSYTELADPVRRVDPCESGESGEHTACLLHPRNPAGFFA